MPLHKVIDLAIRLPASQRLKSVAPDRFPNRTVHKLDISNHIKKKRGNLYLSLVPLLQAFALPITVERATQKPTPICIRNIIRLSGFPQKHIKNINISRRHLPLLCSLTVIKSCEVLKQPKTKRQVNAFLYIIYAPHLPNLINEISA